MSKIGKQPIEVKEGINVSIKDGAVNISGSKGSLSYDVPDEIEVKNIDGKIIVSQKPVSEEEAKRRSKNSNALFGLVRAIINNMVTGINSGFEKKLELSGVGYRAQVTGNELVLSLGFSHPVKIKTPNGIAFNVSENVITISGIDKSLVGDTAAKIRAIRPPEPYKGKGISYKGEKIRRKAGKAAKAVGGK